MTDLATLQPGYVLWTKGENDFGDQRQGGMCVRLGYDPESGEQTVTVLTYSPATPRQPSLWLQERGKYSELGPVARLMRLPMSSVDPHSVNDTPGYQKVWDHAKRALIASTLPPNDHIGTKGHKDLLHAYVVLSETAERLWNPAA